jgi:hypothetical protein
VHLLHQAFEQYPKSVDKLIMACVWAVDVKRTFQLFCAAISPSAIARCVLPEPLGPSRTIFSARSTKPNDASSWI